MKSLSCVSSVPVLLLFVLFAAAGCEGGSESDAAGGEAAMELEPAEGVETGEDAGGGEHAEGGEGGEEGEHDEGGERGGGEHAEGGEQGEEGEHGEGGEHGEEGGHGEEGEESGDYIGRAESWDETRRGMRLTLSYDAARDAFVGTVENTTGATICAVRVEVHLADGPELGPTERQDVGAGESVSVELPAEGESFERWTAHPESSACGA